MSSTTPASILDRLPTRLRVSTVPWILRCRPRDDDSMSIYVSGRWVVSLGTRSGSGHRGATCGTQWPGVTVRDRRTQGRIARLPPLLGVPGVLAVAARTPASTRVVISSRRRPNPAGPGWVRSRALPTRPRLPRPSRACLVGPPGAWVALAPSRSDAEGALAAGGPTRTIVAEGERPTYGRRRRALRREAGRARRAAVYTRSGGWHVER